MEPKWIKVKSKQVMDADGFWTDYTMYSDEDGNKFIFMFGDEDIYGPDEDYADWAVEGRKNADEWFDNYEGFEADDLNESLEDDIPDPELVGVVEKFKQTILNDYEEFLRVLSLYAGKKITLRDKAIYNGNPYTIRDGVDDITDDILKDILTAYKDDIIATYKKDQE